MVPYSTCIDTTGTVQLQRYPQVQVRTCSTFNVALYYRYPGSLYVWPKTHAKTEESHIIHTSNFKYHPEFHYF